MLLHQPCQALDLVLLPQNQVAQILFAQPINLIMQRHDLDLGLEVDLVVMRGDLAILGSLPVLAHHDHGRLNGGEHGQHQIEEDEGIRVEGRTAQQQIGPGPEQQADAKADDKGPGPAKGSHPVRQPLPEGQPIVESQGRIAGEGTLADGPLENNPLLVGQGIGRLAQKMRGGMDQLACRVGRHDYLGNGWRDLVTTLSQNRPTLKRYMNTAWSTDRRRQHIS